MAVAAAMGATAAMAAATEMAATTTAVIATTTPAEMIPATEAQITAPIETAHSHAVKALGIGAAPIRQAGIGVYIAGAAIIDSWVTRDIGRTLIGAAGQQTRKQRDAMQGASEGLGHLAAVIFLTSAMSVT